MIILRFVPVELKYGILLYEHSELAHMRIDFLRLPRPHGER
jgi:hypothetical protein